MWYFKRMNFPSHLPQLLFHSSCLTFNNIEIPSPQPSNMILRLVWNHPRLHEKMAAPMYKLWNESGQCFHSVHSVSRALQLCKFFCALCMDKVYRHTVIYVTGSKSTVVRALLTDEKAATRRLVKQRHLLL